MGRRSIHGTVWNGSGRVLSVHGSREVRATTVSPVPDARQTREDWHRNDQPLALRRAELRRFAENRVAEHRGHDDASADPCHQNRHLAKGEPNP